MNRYCLSEKPSFSVRGEQSLTQCKGGGATESEAQKGLVTIMAMANGASQRTTGAQQPAAPNPPLLQFSMIIHIIMLIRRSVAWLLSTSPWLGIKGILEEELMHGGSVAMHGGGAAGLFGE